MTKMIVPFRRWHLVWLMGEESLQGSMPMGVETLMELERQNSWTAVHDGSPLACGGTIQQWRGRHVAWMYLTAKTGPHMGFITRAVKSALEKVEGRVELTVRQDFDKGHRWAKLLGFQVETPVLEAYGPDGENHVGYVRMNAR